MPAVKLHWYDGGLLPERPDELEQDRPLDAEDGIIFVLRDDKLVYWRDYFDTATF